MAGEVFTKRNRNALVEKNAHSGRFERAGRVFEYCTDLIERDARKPSDEVRDLGPVFEILEQGGNGNTRAAKDPSATHTLGIAFYGRAGRPVNHAVIVDPAWRRFN